MRKKVKILLLTAALCLSSTLPAVPVKADMTANATAAATVGNVTNFKIKKSAMKAYITWTPVEGATGYRVYRCRKENGTYKMVKWIKDPSASSYMDETLKPSTVYYYRLRPMVGSAKGEATDTIKITTYPNIYDHEDNPFTAVKGDTKLKASILKLSYTNDKRLIARVKIKNETNASISFNKVKVVITARGETLGTSTFDIKGGKTLYADYWTIYNFSYGSKSTKKYTDLKYDEKQIKYTITIS